MSDWKIVPSKLTNEMLFKARNAGLSIDALRDENWCAIDIAFYDAMLAAAPQSDMVMMSREDVEYAAKAVSYCSRMATNDADRNGAFDVLDRLTAALGDQT